MWSNDVLRGTWSDDVLRGTWSDDVLRGTWSDDVLRGTWSDDVLRSIRVKNQTDNNLLAGNVKVLANTTCLHMATKSRHNNDVHFLIRPSE